MTIGKLTLVFNLPKSGRRRKVFEILDTNSALKMSVTLPDIGLFVAFFVVFSYLTYFYIVNYSEFDKLLNIQVLTNQNSILSGKLSILPPSSISITLPKIVTFRLKNSIDPHVPKEISTNTNLIENEIIFPACDQHQTIYLSVPFSITSESAGEYQVISLFHYCC